MKTYKDYITHIKKIADVNLSAAVLHWDQEVNMPSMGAAFRHNN